MIFKGIEKRIARELEEEIENMGGHLNAYTSREHTAYYAKVMDNDVPKALDILADILQNSKFDENRINRSKGKLTKQFLTICMQLLFSTLLWAKPFLDLLKISRRSPNIIFKSIYRHTTLRLVITASGVMKHEDIVEQVKKLFTKLSTDPTTASKLVAKEPAIFTGSKVLCWDLRIRMQVLAQRVGINEIAKNMMAFNTNYKDTGLFGVYAIAKPDCLDDLAYAIMYEMSKLCYRVSEVDVTRACNQLKSSLLLHIEGTNPVAEDIGRQWRIIPFVELFARIDAVDASIVKHVAIHFIFDQAHDGGPHI
ncbi:unnamed protein product [Camellia sinensis]